MVIEAGPNVNQTTRSTLAVPQTAWDGWMDGGDDAVRLQQQHRLQRPGQPPIMIRSDVLVRFLSLVQYGGLGTAQRGQAASLVRPKLNLGRCETGPSQRCSRVYPVSSCHTCSYMMRIMNGCRLYPSTGSSFVGSGFSWPSPLHVFRPGARIRARERHGPKTTSSFVRAKLCR